MCQGVHCLASWTVFFFFDPNLSVDKKIFRIVIVSLRMN